MSMKISNDTVGNRTRDLPASSVVPQPNAPLDSNSPLHRLPFKLGFIINLPSMSNSLERYLSLRFQPSYFSLISVLPTHAT